MQAFNLVFVLALAACAFQCRADEFPRSADKVDLRLFVENGEAIAKNMFKAVNSGLDQSKPNMDKILNELAPEAKAMIRKYIDEARAKMKEEETRVNHIFATLTKALDNLKPIKSCSDKVSPSAKKLALNTEKEIVKIIKTLQEKFKEDIQNIKIGAEKVLKKARTLFDTEVEAVVKCLTPGRKDASACLNTELEKVLKGVNEIVVETVILIESSSETISPIISEMIEKMMPLLKKVLTDGRVLLKTLGDCVAALK